MIDKDDFVEWCQVHQNFYGTSKSQIKDIMNEGLIPLLDIDIQGTIKFVKAFPETRTLFIVPPSIDEIERRLIARGTETEQSLKTRVKNASSEIKAGIQTDDESFLIGYRMINKNLEDAKNIFMAFFENLYENELV